MKKIYFVRHGESVMNAQSLVSGHTDTPLNAHGKEQAKAAGKLAREQGLVFDVVLSSPLQRAHHTAKAIASEVGYPVEDIVLHELLKERNFGALEGKDFISHSGTTIDNYLADPYAIDHVEEIEKIEDMHKRASEVWKHLMERPEERILVVSHGAFGRSMQRAAKNLPIDSKVDYIDNAVIIELI